MACRNIPQKKRRNLAKAILKARLPKIRIFYPTLICENIVPIQPMLAADLDLKYLVNPINEKQLLVESSPLLD